MERRRYIKKPIEEIRKQTNKRNMELIGEEATLAKECGISYGKLKANMTEDFEPSEYTFYTSAYIRKSETKEHAKSMAFIR